MAASGNDEPNGWRTHRSGDDEESKHMPKMKTDRGAAKRFKITGRGQAAPAPGLSHRIFEKKPSKRTRRLGREVEVAPADVKAVKRLLGI